MTSEQQAFERHLAGLDAFMASEAYVGYLAARDQELLDVKNRILMTPPVSQDAIATQLMSFGELDCLEEMKKCFEVARSTLKDRISEITDRENEAAETTKQ